MSIASEITRINNNIAAAYTALDGKGATLPETQNSANLADTIDTISAGGSETVRGNWVVPQAYLDFEEIISNETLRTTGSGDSNKDVIYGFLFKNTVPNFSAYLVAPSQAGYINYLKTSDGASYDSNATSSNAEQISHTFDATKDLTGGYRYIIAHVKADTQPYIMVAGMQIKFFNCVKYIVIKTDNYSTKLSKWLSNFNISYGTQLESYKFINSVGVSQIDSGYFATCGSYCTPSIKYIPSIAEMGNPTVTFTSLQTNTGGKYVSNLPYGLDLSTVTSDITLGGASYANTSSDFQAYVTLPPVNVTMHTNTNSTYFTTTLSKDNWAYIAEHAPTVSGKTLTMGQINIDICGGTSGTIITTLTNKGWTVS